MTVKPNIGTTAPKGAAFTGEFLVGLGQLAIELSSGVDFFNSSGELTSKVTELQFTVKSPGPRGGGHVVSLVGEDLGDSLGYRYGIVLTEVAL